MSPDFNNDRARGNPTAAAFPESSCHTSCLALLMHRRAPNLKQNRVRPLSAAPTLYSSSATYDQSSYSNHNSSEVGDGQYEQDGDTGDRDRPQNVTEQQQQYDQYSDHPSDYSTSSSIIMAFERLKINIEIFLENIADMIGASYDSLRKPILALACFALIMTLKAGKRGIARMKGVTRQAYSPYGTPGGVPKVPPTSSAYGQRPAYPAGAASPSSPYNRNTLQTTPNAYGQPAAAGGAYGAASSYGGAAAGGGGLSGVAGLVDMHGATIRVMQPGLFKDYGAVTDFQGQVETLHGFESAAVVEQVLNQPGMLFLGRMRFSARSPNFCCMLFPRCFSMSSCISATV